MCVRRALPRANHLTTRAHHMKLCAQAVFATSKRTGLGCLRENDKIMSESGCKGSCRGVVKGGGRESGAFVCKRHLQNPLLRRGSYLRRMRAPARSDQLNKLVRHTPLPQSHEGYGAEGAPLWRGEASPSPPPWQPSVRRFRKKVYRGFQGVPASPHAGIRESSQPKFGVYGRSHFGACLHSSRLKAREP